MPGLGWDKPAPFPFHSALILDFIIYINTKLVLERIPKTGTYEFRLIFADHGPKRT